MNPLMRDAMAIAGVLCLAIGAWLVHPALAFLLIGAALIGLWVSLVPDVEEAPQ